MISFSFVERSNDSSVILLNMFVDCWNSVLSVVMVSPSVETGNMLLMNSRMRKR